MDSKMFVLIILIVAFVLLICCFVYLSYAKKQQEKYEEKLIKEIKKNKEVKSPKEEFKPKKNQVDLEAMLEKMQQDLEGQNKDKVVDFEQEQEDTSIISYKELKKAVEEFDESEELAQEKSPISVKDVLAIRKEEIEKQEDPILSMLDKQNDSHESKKFHNTDFISPIYGKQETKTEYPKVPVYEEQEEVLSVLNDDTLENEKFLNELKDFRKQL